MESLCVDSCTEVFVCVAGLRHTPPKFSAGCLMVQACICLCVFLEVKHFVSPLMAPSFGPVEKGKEGLLREQFVTACLSCEVPLTP